MNPTLKLLPIALLTPLIMRAESRKNVLFILVDDMQNSVIHYNGNEQVVSPNIDDIYRTGVSYTNTYTNGSISGALSMPSRAMIMTGQGVFGVHSDGQYIPEEHITMPEHLRANGYTTFGTGKWHNGSSSYHRSFTCGDCIFFGGMHGYEINGHVSARLHHYDPTGKYKEKPFIAEKFSSEMYADAAVKFLESQKKAKDPFFAFIGFTSPHDPRNQHPSYGHKYDSSEIELPINFLNRHPFNNGDMYVRDEVLLPHYREEGAMKADLANYYGMVSEVDTQIGRIIEALKESGKYDDTIIIFTSDNGLAVGQHGLLGKQNLYEHSISVPMVVSLPESRKASESDAYCYLSDIYPTVCDLVGVNTPDCIGEGRSFAPTITNNQLNHRKQLFLAYNSLQRALVRDGWKYIVYNVDGCQTEQLFNLNDDPWEMVNLASLPQYKMLKNAYRKELKKEMKKGNDFCDLDKPMWGTGPNMTTWEEGLRLYK